MYKLILAGIVAVVLPDVALAGKKSKSTVSITSPGPVSGNNTNYVASGNINGTVSVSGSNNTLVNNGNINGTNTGVSMTGGSSKVVNNGSITATSTGTSSASAVGLKQGN